MYFSICSKRMQYMICGPQDEPQDYQGYYSAPEPSTLPTYSYNTNSLNRNDAMLYQWLTCTKTCLHSILSFLFFFLNLSVEGILKCNLKHLRHVFKYSNVKRSIQSANASNSPLQSVMQNGISKPYTLGTKQNLLNLKRVLKLIFKKSKTNRPALGNKWFR